MLVLQSRGIHARDQAVRVPWDQLKHCMRRRIHLVVERCWTIKVQQMEGKCRETLNFSSTSACYRDLLKPQSWLTPTQNLIQIFKEIFMMCINNCDDPETMVIKLLLLLLFTIVLMSCIRKGKTERVLLNSWTTRWLWFIITCISDDKEEKENKGKRRRQQRRRWW